MSLPVPNPNSRALITGASSGIGEAIAESLAMRGHSLILVARRADRLRTIADRLAERYHVTVDIEPCDLTDRGERTALRARLSAHRIDIACLNAGFATYGALAELDAEREIEQVELNVTAVHEFVVALLPAMVERGSGALLITGSTAGNQPSPCNATYAASKAFANTLSESLHGELKGTSVTCTLLAPGPVVTEFAAVSDLGRLEKMVPSFAWVTAEQAAEAAVRGMAAGRRRVVPGATSKVQDIGGRHAPRSISNPLLRKVYGGMR